MAGGTNVGNLNATLSLSAFEFTHGLDKSKDELGLFAREAEEQSRRANNALNNVGKGGGRFNAGGAARIAQQLGFGIQDFSSQVMNSKNMVDGLGRGISAVSNNVQMLGAAFDPIGLASTAIGGALAGLVLPSAIKWMTNSDAVEKSAKKTLDHYEQMAERMEKVSKIRNSTPDSLLSNVKQLEQEALVADQTAKAENSRVAMSRKRYEDLKSQSALDEAAVKKHIDTGNGGSIFPHEYLNYEQLALRNEKRQPQLDMLKAELDASKKRADDLSVKADNARAALNLLKPDVQMQRQAEINTEIKKFKLNADNEDAIRANQKLQAEKLQTEAEIALLKGRIAEESTLNKAALKNELEDREVQLEKLTQVMAGVDSFLQSKIAAKNKLEQAEKEFEFESKGQEQIDAIRRRGLESYGSEYSKMKERQKRERRELEHDTLGRAEQPEALRNFDTQAGIDRQKLRIDEREKYLSSLGPDAHPSAGVDLSSSEGISAINRALSGAGEHTIAKQQLEVEKQQLLMLETLAGMKPDMADAALAASKGNPALGEAVPMDSMPMTKNGKIPAGLEKTAPEWSEQYGKNTQTYDAVFTKQEREFTSSFAGAKKVDEVLEAKRSRERGGGNDEVNEVLTRKRQREAEKGDSGNDIVKAILELKKINEEMARKPVFKVVSLSG